jgi:hypothetical protein
MRPAIRRGWLVAVLLVPALARGAGVDAYRALGFEPQDVLSGTVLNSKVVPGDEKQVVCIATYFTGKKAGDEAVNVRMGVFARAGDELTPLYTRDFGVELSGPVGNGDLQLLDLDRDGVNEIILSLDDYGDPLVEKRVAEVILYDEQGFRTVWSGPVEYDATKAARGIPEERRDRFTREIDIANTLRTRGITLFFEKRVIAVAGERLPQPKIVRETFPLRAAQEY